MRTEHPMKSGAEILRMLWDAFWVQKSCPKPLQICRLVVGFAQTSAHSLLNDVPNDPHARF